PAAAPVEPVAALPDFPPAAPAMPAPPPVALAAADVNADAFAKFVASGPYGRDDRALLEFLARKAPEFCRPLLMRTVARTVPRIVFDGGRTGWGQRSAGYHADPAIAGSTPLVALSPGPILVERRRGLFGKDYAVLPESDALYAELGLPSPKLEASKKGAANTTEEDGRWGPVKVYADRSRRATYSPQQQAGDLLYELLLIGLQREGFGASDLAARTWADTARFLLYARLRDELGHDAFLDPDRRVELRERLERPDEARDRQLGAWASARSGLLDPRRGTPASQLEYERAARSSCARSSLADRLYELARKREAAVRAAAALAESGLADESAAAAAIKNLTDKEAAQRGAAVAMPACASVPAGREDGLRRSAALIAEAARIERAFRDARSRAGDKDAP
ncbi:MAG: hypothetical protein SF051_09385, partial [Elusimicrobiota bacterium]|nr:hypothetical protein [Elusimicrobiota bacterium]